MSSGLQAALGFVVTLGLSATACSDSDAKKPSAATPDAGRAADSGTRLPDSGETLASEAGVSADAATGPVDYADPASWLCLKGKPNDVCHENLDATIIHADGTLEEEPHVVAADPPADCFYVYPTISADPAPNSDLVPGPEEIGVTKGQAARLTSVCTVFAPMYRQVTLGALFGSLPPGAVPDREMPYQDVLAAFDYYMAHYNAGRPFVLIGHSQGAGVLKRLVQEKIDGDAALRGQLVSAMLIGGNIAVSPGKDVGQDFENVPLCRTPTNQACVVAYSTFRDTAPPGADTLFGKVRGGGPGEVACNDPAALAGGKVTQKPYFAVAEKTVLDVGALDIKTPYVTVEDFLDGECVSKDGVSYLELHVNAGDGGNAVPRAIGGDLTPAWGLHLIDVHVAMGDIVTLAGSQIAAH